MNEKITFPRLATLLADRSGRSKRFSEDFLREFFSLISESLGEGESVKVKGLGTFRLTRVEPRRSVDVTTGQPMEISGHSKVVFIPSKELAEAVNAPFEAFTAIEISDEADISQLFTKEEIELQEDTDDSLANSYREQEADPEHEPTIQETAMQAAEDTIDGSATKRDSSADEAGSAEDGEKAAEGITADEETTDEEDTEEEGEAEEGGADEEDTDYEATASEETKKAVSANETEYPIEEAQPTDNESEAEETEAEDGEDDESDIEYEAELEELDTPRRRWVRTLMISLGAALFALIATFAIWYVFATNDFHGMINKRASSTVEQTGEGFVVGGKATIASAASTSIVTDTLNDTASTIEEPDVPTAPSDPIVTDTISTTRYLTTMAKAHYGNYNLWPYIYEENKGFLGHPDRIRPGTPVVIPNLSKYGVDPSDPEAIEKAKKMGVAIYARYGKKI